jgi:hypothetical protein
MSVATENSFTVDEDSPLRRFNLMSLPLETLHHVLSFLPMDDIVKFGFVCRRAFEVAKAFTWDYLDFSCGTYWLDDIWSLCDRAQTTCRKMIAPVDFRYYSSFSLCQPISSGLKGHGPRVRPFWGKKDTGTAFGNQPKRAQAKGT